MRYLRHAILSALASGMLLAGALAARSGGVPKLLPWQPQGTILRTFSAEIPSIATVVTDENHVRAPAPGQVLFAGPFRSFGELVILRHSDTVHSIVIAAFKPSVEAGAFVSAGDILGSVSAPAVNDLIPDGEARTGTVVTYEVRIRGVPVDPLSEIFVEPEAPPAHAEIDIRLPATAPVPEQRRAPARSHALPWPARGTLIRPFGTSDGIDLALPLGTSVAAVDDAVVIYAGDGLSEFGTTLLLRHHDGLVSVYAYLDALLVGRGDQVRRGQEVARSGKSGNTDTPVLHFEIRINSSPVDPLLYLE
jgi:septal ring factor EnvC (AmiA/AmiB activator)